jgi:hypothetical protein
LIKSPFSFSTFAERRLLFVLAPLSEIESPQTEGDMGIHSLAKGVGGDLKEIRAKGAATPYSLSTSKWK